MNITNVLNCFYNKYLAPHVSDVCRVVDGGIIIVIA